jgi:hypothetical protein
MTMQTDVKAKQLSATAAAAIGPARIKSVYFVSGASAGTLSFKDGGSGGTELLLINTPAGVGVCQSVLLPGEGVRFTADPYVTITNTAFVTFFYG